MEETKQYEIKEIKESKIEKKQNIKIKECRVLFFDKLNNILHLDFDGFGIQVVDQKDQEVKEKVNIQYTSEIGMPDFTFKLVK